MSVILTFIQQAIVQGITILFGATGEIMTEKSGNLNLGIPGIMYMGGVSGLMGAYLYENSTDNPSVAAGVVISCLACALASFVGGLIYTFLTVSLRANQNVVGGSLSKMAGGVGQISVATTASGFQATIPGLSRIPVLGDLLFSYGFLTYVALVVAGICTYILTKTRAGLHLIAVGESPATADAAGINVTKYKYTATLSGAVIAGFGGLYFVMEYLGGTWQNNQIGDRGWLAVALVILALWNPAKAIYGSLIFGGLYILYLYIPGLGRAGHELIKMTPFVVTIIVLIFTSRRNKPENQPPASLGTSYFREER